MARIAIFGAGYVGLVTGACFADLGHEVVVRDILPERIEELRAGRVPIHEPGLEGPAEAERRAPHVHARRPRGARRRGVRYSSRGHAADVLGGRRPVGGVDGRRRAAPPRARPDARDEEHRARRHGRQGAREPRRARPRAVGYVSNPEFLAEGTAVSDFTRPDRVVVGAFEEADGARVAALYDGIETTIVRTDVASAEMIKLAANAFLTTRISFINEIANVCELDRRGRDEVRGASARPPARLALPARRRRLRRKVLPEGRLRAQAARRQTPATTSSSCRP